jgi:hypothetical protein
MREIPWSLMVRLNDGQHPAPERMSLREAVSACAGMQAGALQLARIWLPCAMTLIAGVGAASMLDADEIMTLIGLL